MNKDGYFYPKRRTGKYEVGKSYLVRTSAGRGSMLFKITIVEITKTSMLIKYENGYTSWKTKEVFDYEYSFLEEL